jgi:hypothetical protein
MKYKIKEKRKNKRFMKIRITENQYEKLTEGEDNDFESYLLSKFPNINDLKMVRANTRVSGPIRRYLNPVNDVIYFRVEFTSTSGWKSGIGSVESDPFVRLYVPIKIYKYAKKYGMNFEYDLMDWFNKTYNENVNSVIKTTNSI